ncbi:DUF2428 domain-containing protein [Cephalotus follicularis]|uniref:DUF2428 domain-containing protein n=1 Tax=Cephalotus follicularis TaxID=3775 RepID=A0A1Q3BWR7_CEPFO|nr:DUF2428 domain-containing protein [Cephalotus follicularis]
MSAKWRALQHRHRYTYSAVIFPQSYTESLTLSPPNPKLSPFYSQLQQLISLNSIYSQVNHVKKLSSSFIDILSNTEGALVLEPTKLYLEILFLENSLPLHRTLVSALAKTRNHESLICGCFRALCEEYGSLRGQGKRFSVSRVALSVMGMPKLGYLIDVIEECAILVVHDIVFGLSAVVKETEGWSRPSPIVMEQCQESLSCLYYLLQRFPVKFKDLNGFESENVMEMVLEVLLSLLKSMAFSRDCYVAAGVSFCAALQVCLSVEELGLVIFEGIFYSIKFGNITNRESQVRDAILKIPHDGDVCGEIHSFSVLSRLCLIRGILTAVSRTVLNTQFFVSSDTFYSDEVNGNYTKSVNTILYDAILPELCSYCENPTDSHFNFHALTVMQICLQQIKTSLLSGLTKISENYNPIPEEVGTRILRIIWNNLEDPLSQTVKQVHLVFDIFLDIQSILSGVEDSERIKLFLQKIAANILCLGSRCKSRYVPLASLTKRLGARTMLDMNPHLLYETIQAYIDDDVCCAATSFLKCFLEYLRDECWSRDGIERGYVLYRGLCMPPILYGLSSGVTKLRSNLNTYALPVLLEVDVDSIFPMLAFISVGPSGKENGRSCPELGCIDVDINVEQKVAVLVSLLKVSRSLALIEGDIDFIENPTICGTEGELETEHINLRALICVKGVKVEILVEWLVLALTHADESLRVDAAESLLLNPKTSSLPSHLELTLMKEAVPLNMRCSSTAFQMKWATVFRKFFSRVRTALERQLKQGSWQPLVSCDNKGTDEAVVGKAEDLFNFMRWLSCFLFFSCYPSAPYKRKVVAMELILIMMNVWSVLPPQEKCDSISSESCLYPYSKGITSPDSTMLLVGSIIDSWDRLRESSFRILLHFPTPLPGISSEDMVQKVITWAKKLVCSSRVRESDAGALTLRLIFRKYVSELQWVVRASVNVVSHSQSELVNDDFRSVKFRHPVVEYIDSLIDWLDAAVELGERDLSKACENSFVHGVLLTLRYTFEELDWNSDAVLSSISEMRHALEKLLKLVMRITSLALWVVSADAWHLPEDMDEMVSDDTFLLEAPYEVDLPTPLPEQEEKNVKIVQDVRPSDQIVVVGCWLAMKEVSLVLGTIIRKLPLPSSSHSDLSESGGHLPDAADVSIMEKSDMLLDLKQLERIGSHFLEVLLKMKHNGAIDKTRAGFTALCNRLLCSNDPRLCKLTETWMEQLMDRTVAKGQLVDDLLRRSAGIPAAFMALFLSEPEGAPKKLLPRALRWLIDVVNGPLLDAVETCGPNINLCKSSSALLNLESESIQRPVMKESEKISKIRDEGVVPTVHAFNVLRAAFNDTNLATDTSGFSAEALIVSICSFSSPYWEVRNSACLAYTALVRRMIGFLNVQKRESVRRAVTGLEFFHRLKSSTVASQTGDNLDPFLFMPFIRKCSTQSNLRVRVLASRALTGLVSNEKLSVVLCNIASELPFMEDQITATPVSSILLCPIDGTYRASFNLIHGMLLQLCSLLDSNCRNLADFSKKDQILGDLIQVLSVCSWIASPKLCPCPILNASFLRVLDHMLSISRTGCLSKNFFAIRNLLLELSGECLDVEASYGLSYYDPTIAELREQAAISYFRCVFQVSEEVAGEILIRAESCSPSDPNLLNIAETENSFSGLQGRLIRSLSDSSYEVRLATLKWLLKFLKLTECCGGHDPGSSEIKIIQHWTKTNLQETLMNLLDLEKNQRCMYNILRILYSWNLQQFQKLSGEKCTETIYIGGMDCNSVIQIWDKLMSLYKLTRHTKTRETLICCLAICVKRFAGLFTSSLLADLEETTKYNADCLERSACVYECITFFVNLIKQHSSSSEPVNMRKATVESILASGLLEQAEVIGFSVVNHQIPSEISSHFDSIEAVNMYARQVLDIWFTCIKLLEDEDDVIRQRLAVDVQKCIFSKKCGGRSDAGVVPNQVEKVIELSFRYLSSVFGHWIEYVDYLLCWVLNAANYVVSTGDLVRKVFDKEIDNHHEEKLLISQICCSHLEELLMSSWVVDLLNMHGAWDYLHSWRMRFCHQLMSFAKDHVEKQGEVDWIGGVGNHKDSFLPLYANLLGFYVLSKCIFKWKTNDRMPVPSDVFQLGRIINPFLQNPLICNLYLIVLRIHEKEFGNTADHLILESRENSCWDEFDPYFLLR